MLHPDNVMEAAVRRCGLTNFGEAPLLDGLTILCESINREAGLNEVGQRAFFEETVGTLVERLKIEECFAQNPEIEQQEIVAPLMVMGLPRSGTTALSHMLSRDPRNRSIRRWEAASPAPPPDPQSEAQDPRRIATQAALDRQFEASPELMKMNPLVVDDPSESLSLMRMTFQSSHFGGFYRAPTYLEWVLSSDMVPVYRYLERTLKLLQTNYPDVRWNLKYPNDLFSLPAIAEVFPDAHFIWIHRDPVKSVPSVASLLAAFRRPFVDEVDKVELGRAEMELLVERVRRGVDYRSRSDAKPFVDVRQSDLLADPTGTISGIYERLGIAYTEVFDAALRDYRKERPAGRFGAHEYTAAEFGLDGAEIARRFAFYREALGV